MGYFRRTDSYLDSFTPHIAADPAYHYQDFSAHLAIFNQAQVDELPRYVEDLGITSFKLYMNLKAPLARNFLIDPLVDDQTAQTADLDYDDGLLFGLDEGTCGSERAHAIECARRRGRPCDGSIARGCVSRG